MLNHLIDRIRLLFRKNKESYFRFYRILGFFPHNISYYEQALLHKSLSVKKDNRWVNNERLEFLGDAVLDAVVGDIVYRRFPGKREGFLTNTRSKIVQRETLNRLAVEIGLDKQIKYLSHQSAHNNYMPGNAFEAIVGAIYLDRGYEQCKYFMEHRNIGTYMDLERISAKEVNFKSKLLEWCQKNHFELDFKLITETHDDLYSPVFESEVYAEKIFLGRGKGYAKKESQQRASEQALGRIKKDADLRAQIVEAKQKREQAEEPQVASTDTEKKEEFVSARETLEEEMPRKNNQKENVISAAEEQAYKGLS